MANDAAPPALEPVSLDDMIACAEREVGMRERAYPRWVSQHKLTQKLADRELRCMRSIHRLLVEMKVPA